MRAIRKQRVIFCLSILFGLFILNRYLLRAVIYVTSDIQPDYSRHRFPNVPRDFGTKSLTLHPKCLCQKEVVLVNKFNDYYEITVQNVFNPKNNSTNNFFQYNVSANEFESVITCDLYKVLRRGPHQNIVSYSMRPDEDLHNFKNIYMLNVKNNLIKHYKNWVARVYYSSNQFSQNHICELECVNHQGVTSRENIIDFCAVDMLPFDTKSKWDASFMSSSMWRWLPLGDEFVDAFISRNVDSCIFDREISAVDKWIKSKTLFHVMRDHPLHDAVIMPGLWGFISHANRLLANGMFHMLLENSFNERVLEDKFWPIVKRNSTIHDSYHCKKLGGEPFPVQRNLANCFVGQYGCCGALFNQDLKLNVCPIECRPAAHKNDWEYC